MCFFLFQTEMSTIIYENRGKYIKTGHEAPVPYSIPTAYVQHEYMNWGYWADTPSTFPAHCTDCPCPRALNHISAAGRSHPRTLPGRGAVVQGWASLPTLCPATCPSLVQTVQFAKKPIRAMLGSCNSVQGSQHLWYTAYRHSFTTWMTQLNEVNQQ